MKIKKFVVMYGSDCIGSFNVLELAIAFIETCKSNDFYIKKNAFNIYSKMSF